MDWIAAIVGIIFGLLLLLREWGVRKDAEELAKKVAETTATTVVNCLLQIRWTPNGNEKPEGWVLISVNDVVHGDRVHKAKWNERKKLWYGSGGLTYSSHQVKAWQPLPEPYKE